ncbi:MAG: hypothetical protein FWG71_00020 [Synergistaceae bacterium]|nr:hypothetical protein [Synergistaceae bacterium]
MRRYDFFSAQAKADRLGAIDIFCGHLAVIGGFSIMSEYKNKIKLFEEKQIRAIWDEEAEK